MDKVLKLTPIYGALLIFLGFLYSYYYYVEFQIEIFSYLNSGEIILSFLPVINYILIVLIFFGLGVCISILREVKWNRKTKSHNYFKIFKAYIKGRFINKLNFWVVLNGLFFEIVLGPLGALAFLVFMYFDLNTNESFQIKYLPLKSALFTYYFKTFIIDEVVKKIDKSFHGLTYMFFISFFSYLLIVVSARMKADRILKDNSLKKMSVSFLFQGSPISTNDSILFVGQTQNYLFLHNKNSKENFVYNRNEIKSFLLK